jgi:hypothetical protein
MRSVQAALGELLRGSPDTAPGVPATTVPTPYNADALATHLAGDAESPVAEEDPETAEAMADPAAAAEAEEDAEAAEAGGDVSSHSGRSFSDSLADGHFDQPMPSAPPSVSADGYESDARSVDEVPESDHESGRGCG